MQDIRASPPYFKQRIRHTTQQTYSLTLNEEITARKHHSDWALEIGAFHAWKNIFQDEKRCSKKDKTSNNCRIVKNRHWEEELV